MFEPNSTMNAKLYTFLAIASAQMIAVLAIVVILR